MSRTNTPSVVLLEWDDVPHLSEQAKKELLASIPPYQREARAKGVPMLGAGAIYPVAESEFVIDPFELPAYYPRCYGLDVGWNRTAAVWMARDNETQTYYLYAEHYTGKEEPALHAAAIKGKGDWISGVIDPASCGSSQIDGRKLIDIYRNLGLKLGEADNAVDAGIYQVWNLLSTGKLKVFSGLQNWLKEFRMYQRDEDGKVKKVNDHLMDATRYCVMSGPSRMQVKPNGSDRPRARCHRLQMLARHGHNFVRRLVNAVGPQGRKGKDMATMALENPTKSTPRRKDAERRTRQLLREIGLLLDQNDELCRQASSMQQVVAQMIPLLPGLTVASILQCR